MNNAYNYGYIYFLKLLRKDEYVLCSHSHTNFSEIFKINFINMNSHVILHRSNSLRSCGYVIVARFETVDM